MLLISTTEDFDVNIYYMNDFMKVKADLLRYFS